MTTTIENKINLDNISNDGYIDHLILRNNLYNDDINLDSLIIGKLEIINIRNYHTKFFNDIIGRVNDGGELIIRNVVLDRLDCSRFDRVELNGCSIQELIKGECEIECEYLEDMPFNLLYGKGIEYEEGIYNGFYYINKNNKIIKNGIGAMIYKDGSVYEGEWKYDMRWYEGTMRYNDGNMFEGEWLCNMRWGKGTMKYNDGSVYEGKWINDRRNGKGTMKYNDGIVYKGKWMNNKHVHTYYKV